MTRTFLFGSIILGLSCLAAGWARAGHILVGFMFIVLIPISLLLLYRKFSFTLGIILTVTVVFAALGVWSKVDLSLALIAVVCALAAWDLTGFLRRLAFASDEDLPAALERQHLSRLNLVMFIGVGINLLTQTIRYNFGFEWTIVLAIMAFYGLGTLITGIRSEHD